MLSANAVECLRRAAFVKGLKAASAEEGIEQLLARLDGRREVLDFNRFRRAIFERQAQEPPLLPGGIAFPHARTDSVQDLVMAVGTTPDPINFDGSAVRLIFLIGAPKSAVGEYLALLSFLARHLREGKLIDRLVRVENMVDFLAAFGD